MKLNSVFFTLVVCIIIFSCNSKAKRNNNVNDFETFYEKFHNDTAFQLDRIIFPLPGLNTDEMSVLDSNYFWQREDWEFHKKPEVGDSNKFTLEINKTDSVVEEIISSTIPGFVFKRKFKKIDGEWYLVRLENVNL